ncbi:CAP domain-containing protein [Blastococcus saxobsidens]|uniref:CAP domain-containing protein n=1 Tax=Blastococcus saxobsidens TaxID=138336 RepID=A0A6L9W3X3_9ACTN|nr:CAP domain-containing protein [Blastococcus saxobsidens]NEK86150.1 CAP domain-containing protein [Blastococcus saxobsidens]
MHHRPSGPPLSARLTAPVRAARLLLRHWLGRHGRRLGLGIAVTVAVTAVVLAVPVSVPAPGRSSVALAPSSIGSPSGSPSAGPSSAESSTSAFPDPSPAPTAPGAGPSSSAAAPPPAPAEVPPPASEAPEAPASTTAADAPTTSPRSSAAATTPRETSAAAPPPAPLAAATPAATGIEGEVLALTNAARAEAGCGPLVADAGLAAVARAHSADMRDRGFFAHDNPSGQNPFQRAGLAGVAALAENIARGQQDAADVMDSWMNSPGHRANILDCRLTRLGLGVATGAGGPWWTQLFG